MIALITSLCDTCIVPLVNNMNHHDKVVCYVHSSSIWNDSECGISLLVRAQFLTFIFIHAVNEIEITVGHLAIIILKL